MICPNCGYDVKKKKFAASMQSINMYLSQFSESTQSMLQNIINIISDNHVTTQVDLYNFYKKIHGSHDDVVRFTIDQYYKKNLHITHSLAYLAAMISNYEKNHL